MSEKRAKEERAMGITKEKHPEAQFQRPLRHRHLAVVKFKNKKHTLGRLKWSTTLNNWNNRTDICADTFAPTIAINYLYLMINRREAMGFHLRFIGCEDVGQFNA